MKKLDLYGVRITDAAPLKEMTNLRELHLWFARIATRTWRT